LTKVTKEEKDYLIYCIDCFNDEAKYNDAIQEARSQSLHDIFVKYPEKYLTQMSLENFKVYVDRKKALFSTWYEFFPRSSSEKEGEHGTFKDCERSVAANCANGI
jgi:starch synthase (maltosyl-transferring)